MRSSSSRLALWVLGCVLLLGGCGARQAPAAPRGTLILRVEPAEARVYIDDQRVGSGFTLRERPLRLRVGPHLMSIRSPGYFPHDSQVRISADEPAEFQIELVPIPR
jgi:hypothetical protein